MDQFDTLKLSNQLCFPLYVVAKEIVRKYKPYLDKLDLTYTQYITMMVLWEDKSLNVKEIGKRLYLDSGTLTPLLKQLEYKGYVTRVRNKQDERNLIVEVTNKGLKLKDKAQTIPIQMAKCLNLDQQESLNLYKLLYKLLDKLND